MAGFRKAERRKAKLRLGMSGPAGSGKTASALQIAYGLTGNWEEIGLVDTENGSGELYVGATIGGIAIGEYNVLSLSAPYTPDKYIAAIKEAENAGLKVVILDSISHAWAGEGGLLDLQGKIAAKSGNSWTAWRDVTPKHNAFVEAMLSSPLHIIATMRAKMDYVQEKDEKTGKTTVRKVGMAPIQREGMDYEFTVVFDLSIDHIASCSKDRTNLFDGQYFRPTPETGKMLLQWLEQGVDAPVPQKQDAQPPVDWPRFWAGCKKLGYTQARVHEIAGESSISHYTREQAGELFKKLESLKQEERQSA
jgi:hypothetical protein